MNRPSIALFAVLLSGCLEPRVDDDPHYSHRVQPKNAEIPFVEGDVRLAGVLRSNDGLAEDVVPIRTAFLAGESVDYWDVGPASTTVKPVWILREAGDGRGNIEHLPIVDTVPGDDDYGPIRRVFAVHVTKAYNGERITSFDALEDAVELGLVEEPVPTDEYFLWPIVRVGASVALPGDNEYEAGQVYHRGLRVPCLQLDELGVELGTLMVRRNRASANTAYSLTPQWAAGPLDEVAAESDFNDDGDQNDSNLIFVSSPESKGYTGLVSITDVTMASTYLFADATGQDDLFPPVEDGPTVPAEDVIDYADSGEVFLRPLFP